MMALTDFSDDLPVLHIQIENEQELKREAFRQVNASLALEGFKTDEAQLAQQEEIRGD